MTQSGAKSGAPNAAAAGLRAPNGHRIGVFAVRGKLTAGGQPLVTLVDRTGVEHPMAMAEALEVAEMLLQMARRAHVSAVERAMAEVAERRQPTIQLVRG